MRECIHIHVIGNSVMNKIDSAIQERVLIRMIAAPVIPASSLKRMIRMEKLSHIIDDVEMSVSVLLSPSNKT